MSSSSSLGGVLSQPPPAFKPAHPMERAAASNVQAVTGIGSSVAQAPANHAASPQGKAHENSHLIKTVRELQQKVASYSPELKFSIDQQTGKNIVKLTDTSTNTLIWQYPSEEAMQVAKEIDKFQQGLVINYKA